MAIEYKYYLRTGSSRSGWFTSGKVYRLEPRSDVFGRWFTIADDGNWREPCVSSSHNIWEKSTEHAYNLQEGGGAKKEKTSTIIDLDHPDNIEEAINLAERLALVIVNDQGLHNRARSWLNYAIPSLSYEQVRQAMVMEEGEEWGGKFRYRQDKRAVFTQLVTKETANQLGLLPPYKEITTEITRSNIKETTMTTVNYNKAPENFTRVFGCEITNMSDGDLMDMIRKAKKHIDSLSDLKDISRKVSQEITDVEESITILVKQLDKDC